MTPKTEAGPLEIIKIIKVEQEVDPVPSKNDENDIEEEVAGRLAESRPAELDIEKSRVNIGQPLVLCILLCLSLVWKL